MEKRRKSTRDLTVGAMLTALGLILSYVEALIPFSVGLPGIKLGFANIVIVYTLYRLGGRTAFLVNVCRVLLSALLFGSAFSALYALAGALVSFSGMVLLKRLGIFSTAGVSMAGGVLHNLGQLAVATAVVDTVQVLGYFPVLLFSGIAAGLVNGIIATLCLHRLEKIS